MKRVALVSLSALILAGCSASVSGEVKTVEVMAQNMAFDTKEIVLVKGQPTKLILENRDIVIHDLLVDKIAVTIHSSHGDPHEMDGKKPDLHAAANPGKVAEVEFTPTEAGEYLFYCSVPAHKEAGMKGKLIVRRR